MMNIKRRCLAIIFHFKYSSLIHLITFRQEQTKKNIPRVILPNVAHTRRVVRIETECVEFTTHHKRNIISYTRTLFYDVPSSFSLIITYIHHFDRFASIFKQDRFLKAHFTSCAAKWASCKVRESRPSVYKLCIVFNMHGK